MRLPQRLRAILTICAVCGILGMDVEAEEMRVCLWSSFVSGEGDRPAIYLQVVACTWWIGRLVAGFDLLTAQHTHIGE